MSDPTVPRPSEVDRLARFLRRLLVAAVIGWGVMCAAVGLEVAFGWR